MGTEMRGCLLSVFRGGPEVSRVGLSHVIQMLPVFSQTEISGNQTLKVGASCSTTPTTKEIKVFFQSAKRAKRLYVIITITVCNRYMLPLLLLLFAILVVKSERYSCW